MPEKPLEYKDFFLKVKCKICGFTTMVSDEENLHVLAESIDELQCKPEIKKLIMLITKTFNICTDDAEVLINQILDTFNVKKRFKILDCMESIK